LRVREIAGRVEEKNRREPEFLTRYFRRRKENKRGNPADAEKQPAIRKLGTGKGRRKGNKARSTLQIFRVVGQKQKSLGRARDRSERHIKGGVGTLKKEEGGVEGGGTTRFTAIELMKKCPVSGGAPLPGSGKEESLIARSSSRKAQMGLRRSSQRTRLYM